MTYSATTSVTHKYLYVLVRENGRIVFHLGSAFAPPAEILNLGPYTATIFKDGVEVDRVDVPSHWWNARWTWRQQPLAATITPVDIVAQNGTFPYGATGAVVGKTADYKYLGPMDWAGITRYMPQTGERPDIGLLTDPSGLYMQTGEAGPMLAWGQGGGSCPMRFRDPLTDRPIDLLKYPTASAYSQASGNPWMPQGPIVDGWPKPGGEWTPQQAHYCEMFYGAYMATKDLGFLEDLGYSATFTIVCDIWISSQRNKATIYGEQRGVAWALRNLFMVHYATQQAEKDGPLPAYLPPSSYWKTILDNQLAYFAPVMQSADPQTQLYRVLPETTRFGPWQMDFILCALSFAVLTGHDNWKPLYLWAFGNVVQRYSNKLTWQNGGWPPAWFGYYLNMYEWQKNPDGSWNRDKADLTKPLNWYQSFMYLQNDNLSTPPTQAQIDALKVDPLNGFKAMSLPESMMTSRAVLVMADYLDKKGMVNVRATYPDFDSALSNCQKMFETYGSVNPRVAVISDGGIIMPSAVTIAPGQKVHLDVTFTGGQPAAPPTYTQTDATVGALSGGDMSGVLFTSNTKEGKSVVTAATTGANGPISASCEVTVKRPLPTGIALTPGTVS